MSLCLFLLILITTHLAPADGKYAHHLWLMNGYKTLWRKARRHNDKRPNWVLVPFSFFCMNKAHGMTCEAICGCCHVCLIDQVIHWEHAYIHDIIYSVFFLLVVASIFDTHLYASSNQDTSSGPYNFKISQR